MKTPEITHTKGGHEITGFRKYEYGNDKIIDQFCQDSNIVYVGVLVNDYTKTSSECFWTIEGKVINRSVSKYDIEI